MSTSQTPEPGTERTLRTRNPRRRPRNDEDSVKTAPRRKRSKLNEDTFTPNDDEETNGHATMNGLGKTTRASRTSTPLAEMDIPVRSKKKASERHRRADGAVILTQNQCYSVKLLPSTPKELKGHDVEYRANVSTARSRALAITHTQAYIWDYTVHSTATGVRTFEVPFPSKESDPLPFGALVTTGASPEIGLVLISATSGNVTYYESIERAASLSIFPDRVTGVNGSLGGIFSSEQVTDVVAADHAGFIVTLSSGRLIQLTLRDAQGKPKVQAQVLRTNEQSQGGWFGSVKGFLSAGAWRQDVCTARTRALGTKGQMQVIGVTESAQMKIWDLDWSGNHTHRGTVDFKEQLAAELKSEETVEMQGRAEQCAILDFALLGRPHEAKGQELATVGAEQSMDIVCLVGAGYGEDKQYSLVNLSVNNAQAEITRMVQLKKYSGTSGSTRPTIRVPKPGHTAYAIFEDAVVLVAMTDVEMDSPEAQLHGSILGPEPFQDPVYLRREQGLAILGTCEEESRSGQASILAFIEGTGLARFSAVDPVGDVERSAVPVRNKIEQAVFNGQMPENPIDFHRAYSEARYPVGSVEEAALGISREILSSRSGHITAPTTFVETHLTQRAQALQCLIAHLKQHHGALSRETTWKLMWDAERVAAAQTIWQKFEGHLEFHKKGKRSSSLLEAVCDHLQDRFDWEPADEADEDDYVRRFFIRGVARLEKALPDIFNTVKMIREDEKDRAADAKLLRLVQEAGDFWLGAMDTVHRFREEHADVYGIPPNSLKDGVLASAEEFEALPEFWTSSNAMLTAISKFAAMVRETAQTTFEHPGPEANRAMAAALAIETPSLVQLCCSTYEEKIMSCAASARSEDRKRAADLKKKYETERHTLIVELLAVGQAQHAMRLCERYRDMGTLTEVVLAEMEFMKEEQDSLDLDGQIVLKQNIDTLQANVGRYFDKYGDDWSIPFFDNGFSKPTAGSLFELAQKHWQVHLTRYLHGNPSRAKLCWINDVTVDDDFTHAAESLKTAASKQEDSLWAQSVEYSMSRLALLAAQEAQRDAKDVPLPKSSPELEIVRVQTELYDLLRPSMAQATDEHAIKEVVMADHGKGVDTKTPALREQLATSFNDLMSESKVLPLEDLIDVLTLMDHFPADVDANTNDAPFPTGTEFTMALRALSAASTANILPPARLNALLHLFWQRLWLRDDWATIYKAIKTSNLTNDPLMELLGTTHAFSIIAQSHSQNLLDDFPPLPPSHCLEEEATPSPAILRARFGPNVPDAFVQALARDYQAQAKLLRGFVDECRLDEWAGAIGSAAPQYVENWRLRVREQEAEAGAFEEGYVETFGDEGVDGTNGFGNGGIKREEDLDGDGEGDFDDGDDEGEDEERESEVEVTEERDGDGDVEME
ncbi:hypothetical protein MBLNU230_g6299t1 [Neophaeotheca triangularis]